jgi:hypothetical protein
LRLVRDCLEIRVEDGALGIKSFSMSVARSLRIEALSQLELGLGCNMALVLEDDDLVVVERVLNDFEIGIW